MYEASYRNLKRKRDGDAIPEAGIMLAGEGLPPSSKGVRISYAGNKRTVRDGPFTEAKELVAGF